MTAFRHKLIHNSITHSKSSRGIWLQIAAKFHTYGRLLHHTQYAHSRSCNACRYTATTLTLRFIWWLLVCWALHYRSTFIFCSSWSLWGGPFFTFSLPGRGGAHPCPPRQLRHSV